MRCPHCGQDDDMEEMCLTLWELYIEQGNKVDRLRENLEMASAKKPKFKCEPCKKHDPDRESCTCETDCSWMHDHGNTKPEVRHEPGEGL